MKLSKQRKAYVGVLGLGLAALIVDRGFLGSGATAPASASASVDNAQPVAITTASAVSIGRTGPGVTERLDAMRAQAAPDSAPDAFAVVSSWYESAAKPATNDPEKPADPKYHLTSVLTDKAGNPLFAVVNGLKIALSDEVQGIRLIDAGGTKGATPGFATIEVGGERIRLSMKEAFARAEPRGQTRK